MSLVIVSKNKQWLDSNFKPLNIEELQEIIEHREVFVKFLLNKEQSYRIELMKDKDQRWIYKWRNITEDELLRSADSCVEIMNDITAAHITLKLAKEEIEKKESEKNKKVKQ